MLALSDALRDLRLAARAVAGRPLPPLIIATTMALGLGANAAIFSFVDEFLRQPLPVPNGERLVRLFGKSSGGFDVMSYPEIVDIASGLPVLEGVAAHQSAEVGFGTGEAARVIRAELVGGRFFDVLGIRAEVGRTLGVEDDIEGAATNLVVISHRLWMSDFGGDAGVVGRSVPVNGRPFIIAGVAPRGFLGAHPAMAADMWAPLMSYEIVRPRGNRIDSRGWSWLNATARLRPGAGLEEANQALETRVRSLKEEGRLGTDDGFRLVPARALPERLSLGAARALLGFQVISLLVLFVACANIASVVMIRVETRREEMALRRALGASQPQLVSQWLAESLIVALAGGLAALAIQSVLRPAIAGLAPPELRGLSPRDGLPLATAAFTTALAILAGVAAGIVPALRASRIEPAAQARHTAAPYGRRSVFFGLVIAAQLSVSVALLAVTGLLGQSLRQASSLDLGFNPDRLLLGRANLQRAGVEGLASREVMERIAERLREVPEVESATFASVVPLGEGRDSLGFNIPGHIPPSGRSAFSIGVAAVGSEYFDAMQIPIVRGHALESAPGGRLTVVINEAMARRFWPASDPIGRTIELAPSGPSAEIVGVARNIRMRAFGETAQPFIYAPAATIPLTTGVLHARIRPGVPADPRVLQRAVSDAAPGVVVDAQTTFGELRAVALFPHRALAWTTGLFGALTLFLTGMGLFGVVVHAISLRKVDLGIRVALGATPMDVMRSTAAREVPWLAGGLAAGVAGAYALSEGVRRVLDGIGAFEGATLVALSAGVIALVALSLWLPTRQALRIEPARVLRGE